MSKAWHMPSIEEMHTNSEFVEKWVKYSCLDAESTYWLREALTVQLAGMVAKTDDKSIKNMYDL